MILSMQAVQTLKINPRKLKVPTEINGFLVSIIASLYQTPKIENLIL